MKKYNIDEIRKRDQEALSKQFKYIKFVKNGCLIKTNDLINNTKMNINFIRSFYTTLEDLDQRLQSINDFYKKGVN
tara:strand:+ start:1605 stop:1832 length:228 start_codon:yes stop_codon:yes gene_type:complete